MTAPITIECYDPNDQLMPVTEALGRIIAATATTRVTENAPLIEATGRILSTDIIAEQSVPPYANSAMDGYAVACGPDDTENPNASWKVIGKAMAGTPFTKKVGDGEAVQIMTGAVVPDGATCVIAQENAERHADTVVFSERPRTGNNIRLAGEDITIGDTVMAKGTALTPAHLGVLASIGVDPVLCVRPPRIIVFSTGNELKQPGERLNKGEIYDSNRFLLHGLLSRLGFSVTDGGVITDDADSVTRFLTEASQAHDVIITSGGASTGEADHIATAVTALGELNVWRIALRPGRPFAHGRIGQATFFGLPGNPVAVAVTFYQMVQPILRAMMGAVALQPAPLIQVAARGDFRKKPNRAEVYRAVLEYDDNGKLSVGTTGRQGSGILTSMANANCFVLLDHDATGASTGDLVTVQPFFGLV